MSRKDILKSYKSLQRIVQETFKGDTYALEEARARVNAEFRKQDVGKVDLEAQLKLAEDVGQVLSKNVVQLEQNPNSKNYQMKLRETTEKSENYMFQEDAILPEPRSKKCKPDPT